jgi:hypothetical protein
MSQYLQLRQANISRNRAALAAIGLDECLGELTAATDTAATGANSRLKAKSATKRAAPAADPSTALPRSKLPRSCRADSTGPAVFTAATAGAASLPVKHDPLPDFVRAAFDADATYISASSSSTRWHGKRHHQHLTVSQSGQSVATIGCAGYGVALAVTAAATGDRCWLVQSVHHGVGGFGVGLAYSSWRGPFKSLGSADAHDAFGVYHSSGTFISQRREHAAWGPPYAPGDTVGVRVDAHSGSVTFSVNNRDVGTAPGLVPVAFRKTVELAVQPYMGGVARLIE